MRIFQSLWTKPALDKRWDQSKQLEANIWLYSLSAVYAKKQNVTLILYTDTLGKKLLQHLPYDEIHTTLNKIPSNIPTMIWAYGKFMALKEEPLGSVHIDGDVFLKKPEVIKELDSNDYDVVVQNYEGATGIYTDTENKMIKYGVLNHGDLDTQHAFNCGVVGFNNAKLKNTYLDFYFKTTANVAKSRNLKSIMEKDKYFCVDLPLEQHSLAVLSKRYRVKSLLENGGDEWWGNLTKESAVKIGYQHLIGKEKYSFIERVKFTLLVLDKDIYFKTKEAIQKYINFGKEE